MTPTPGSGARTTAPQAPINMHTRHQTEVGSIVTMPCAVFIRDQAATHADAAAATPMRSRDAVVRVPVYEAAVEWLQEVVSYQRRHPLSVCM